MAQKVNSKQLLTYTDKRRRNKCTEIDLCQCLNGYNVLTSIVFQSSSSTFFMGKCGAFMLQNLVTMVNRSRAKGSPLYRGEPEELKDQTQGFWIGYMDI